MKLEISRILHAGYQFKFGETQIVFDPIFENPFSVNCFAFPSVEFDCDKIRTQRWSAVFISHCHEDHCSFESLDLIDRKTAIYIYCVYDEIVDLIRQLGFESVFHLEINTTVKIGDFEITPRLALDSEVDCVLQIAVGDLNILNVVDSWIDLKSMPVLARYAPWDMVLWPFQTLREVAVLAPSRVSRIPEEIPFEWAEQLKVLNPRFIVPSSCQFIHESWSWYNQALFPISYNQFEKWILSFLADTKVMKINPASSIELEDGSLKEIAPLQWVKPKGLQDVDYLYDPNLCPPATSEIAKEFLDLSKSQLDRVFRYCQIELLEEFRSMEATSEPFFDRDRRWRIVLYANLNKPIRFLYSINKNQIENLLLDDQPIDWLTEIPIRKLYSALEEGESLTSLYLRINDMKFSDKIENELKRADPLEDPLVRCLYYGRFASYQRAQLNRIRKRSIARSTKESQHLPES